MEIAKYIIVTFSVLISVAIAKPEYHRIKGHIGGDVTAYEDVMIDKEEELLIGVVAKVTSKRVTPTIGFHDFAAGFSVIKLVEKGVCYIEKGRHTLEEMKDFLLQTEKNDGDYEFRQAFKCTSKTYVKQSEVGMYYGERIAAFCKDYESIFVENEYKMRIKRNVFAIEENNIVCILCWGNCS